MGIFDGILLCSDFDGTMAVSAKVSKENADAIRYFQENGGWFSPTSGRSPEFFLQYADQFRPNAPAITLNGAVIVRYAEADGEDEILHCGTLDHAALRVMVLDMLEHDGISSVHMYHMSKVYSITADEADKGAAFDACPVGMQKIIFRNREGEAEALKAYLREHYGDKFFFSSSWVRGIEVQNHSDTKGNTALRLKKMLGADTLVCVGDYENDLTMIEVADIGYAVGNALDEVKRIANRITVDCSEHAIAAIVRDLENDVKSRG